MAGSGWKEEGREIGAGEREEESYLYYTEFQRTQQTRRRGTGAGTGADGLPGHGVVAKAVGC